MSDTNQFFSQNAHTHHYISNEHSRTPTEMAYTF